MPVLEPPDPPLADDAVFLRPWTRDDVETVHAAFQDSDLHRWLLEVPDPYSRTDAEAFVVERTAGWLSGSQAAFAIVTRATGQVAGGVTLYPDGAGGIVAYWLAAEARGRGYATRALRLVVAWGFRVLGLQRISLWTLHGNERSERVALRGGFVRLETRHGFARTSDGEMDATLFQLDRAQFEENERRESNASEADRAGGTWTAPPSAAGGIRSGAGPATESAGADGPDPGSAGSVADGSDRGPSTGPAGADPSDPAGSTGPAGANGPPARGSTASGLDRGHDPVVPPHPPLADAAAGIRLRPFVPTDAPAIAQICQDPEISRWIPLVPQPYTLSHAVQYVDLTQRNWRDGRSSEFAIVDVVAGELIGSIGLHHLDGSEHRAAVGYWVAREARGRGVATAALRLVSRWAFERPRLERISLWTLPGNRASQSVAERAGYRYEGILRSWDLDPTGATDVVMFGLTRDDLADRDDADRQAAAAAAGPAILRSPPELTAPGTRAAPFVDVLALDDLPPGSMRRVTLAGLDLLVANTPGGVVVTDDRCPHMSAPLSIGVLEGCVVACPLHEGRFDLCSGETVRMPTTGGLDADGQYHGPWSPSGASPKAEPPSKKLEARRLTRVNRLRYFPARIRGGRLEAQIPIVPE